MKITFAKGAGQVFKPRKPRQQREEPLTEGQAARVEELCRGMLSRVPAKRGPERRMVRGDVFSGSFETKVKEAAASLGVSVAALNMDQKQLLVHMAMQSLTDNERREMLAEAAD